MFQKHKCNSYCLRTVNSKNSCKTACRFGFPRPVTKNFTFRAIDESIANRRKLRKKNRFYDLPRTESEKYINDWMPAIGIIWKGNMDAQFVSEKSITFTTYITGYGTKGEKTNIEFKGLQSNKSLHSRLWSLSLKALNHRECGAFEAADALLGYPLYKFDPLTKVRWLNVKMIRGRVLKLYDEIEKLDPESTEIYQNNIIDFHYPHRPVQLENLCLYDFARWFDKQDTEPKNKRHGQKREYYKVNDKLFYLKRITPYLINHYSFNPITQPEEYYYTLLLLFKKWRNHDELKNGENSYEKAFINQQHQLAEAMQYHDKQQAIKDGMMAVEKLIEKQLNNSIEEQDSQENDDAHSK